MDTNTLTEEQKAQLDLIVHKMTRAKEKPEAIQFVVNDFKQKYALPPKAELSFGERLRQGAKNIGKDILGIEQNKSTSFIPSVLRSTIGSQGLAGIAQLPGRVAFQAMNPEENVITPKQALGTTINAGLTAATSGTGSVAKQLGLKGAKNLGARVVENAAIGGGFQTGLNLVEERPLTENLGLSSALGGALPIAGTALSKGKQALLGQAQPTAEMFINSLIKPLQKDFAYGKNPARGILNEGIVANSFDDLVTKVQEKTRLVGEGIGAIGQKLDLSGATLDLTPAITPINEAIERAAKSNNVTLFNSLQNVKTALMHDLQVGADEKGVPAIMQGNPKNLISAGYQEAKEFLSDIAEHTRFTGNPSDDKALNLATKQAYGTAREIMNKTADSVDPQLGVQIRNLNERYSDLLSAKSAINHRDIVMKRQNILNLADKFSIPVAVASSVATGLITGDFSKAGIILAAELATIAGTKALGSTASKTRIAQFLSRLAPEERQGILNSTPALKNLYERITGNVEPDINAPKTKTLQTVEDYLKNPKLGLSLEDVSKSPLAQEARKYKSAEEFVKGQDKNLLYRGTNTTAIGTDQAIFTSPSRDLAKGYGDKLQTFYRQEGKTLDLTRAESSVLEKLLSKELKQADEVLKKYNVPAEIVDDFSRNGISTKNFDYLKTLGERENPNRIAVFEAMRIRAVARNPQDINFGLAGNKEIITAAKREGYDYIIRNSEDITKQMSGTEVVSLNPKKTLKTKSQLTDIWERANKK